MVATAHRPLTSNQIRQFQRDGFLHLHQVLPPKKLHAPGGLRDRLDSLFARFDELTPDYARDLDESPRAPGEPPRNPEITQCLKLDPVLADSDIVHLIHSAADQLLGGPSELGFDHAIRKPPSTGTGTRWHQDGVYDQVPGMFSRLSFWLPLQPVTVEQGCMQFIPASHRSPLRPHHPVSDKPGGHAMTLDLSSDAKVTPCPMQLGDLVVHHPRSIHCTGPNTTTQPRLAWILIFQVRRQPRWQRWRHLLRSHH